MKIKHFLHRLQNKVLWIFNHKLPEFLTEYLSLLQFLWLVHIGSKPLTVSQKSAMIIAPHQDDEVLGCGGLIGLKREQNIPVQIVFITDGAASHSWHSDFKSGEIVPIRRQEALTSLSILGVDSSHIHFLDKPDSKLQYLDLNTRQQIIEELAQLLLSFQPGEVYVPHRQDRTKDHEATYELVKTAIRLAGIKVEQIQYPIWILYKSLLFRDLKLHELAGAYCLSIHSIQSKKTKAIKVYRSQYEAIDVGLSPVLKPAFLRRFSLPYEVFFKTDSVMPND
ncbi:MAG: PIG-L family deacetylase [Mojavia pulchra JT2-VF2]|uniref:PIG-L family deacetylase n=1 Tax=Mojavia pulchra JT2-VF2 TaxID=287848 RepID=A0A951UJ81_9NOST|nr:PIG-L family deacetylase [Mojavia pulchra JT2-VF2]